MISLASDTSAIYDQKHILELQVAIPCRDFPACTVLFKTVDGLNEFIPSAILANAIYEEILPSP